MSIKHLEVLSRADFDEAVVRLRLNVSGIAKATSIPRTYLSEFRNGDRKLRPENLAKLRDYFEAQGVEFDAVNETENRAPPSPQSPHPSLALASVVHFAVRPDLSGADVRDILQEIERNDIRIAELLAKRAGRATGWGGEPTGFEEETESDLRELFARLSGNYVLFRYVTGANSPLEAKVGSADTLHGVMIDTVRESLDRAGIDMEQVTETGEAHEEAA